MGVGKKTVFRRFLYMQCDDFAKYLSEMAAKGWHFKEWGAGLKFEKGEPKAVTYAVEVFTGAGENDTRPEPDTLEFAGYCEAAGWELVDAKQKFCIFRAIREDAVDIMTPEERVQNTFQAMASGWHIGTIVLSGINAVLQWGNLFGMFFADRVFSTLSWFSLLLWSFVFFTSAGTLVFAFVQKQKLKKKLADDETIYIGFHQNTAGYVDGHMIYTLAVMLLILAYLILLNEPWLVIVNVTVIVVTLIFTLVLAKVRLDSTGNIVSQVVFVLLLFVSIMVLAVIAGVDKKEVKDSDLPLHIEDYREKSEGEEDISLYHDENTLGSSDVCLISCGDDSLMYEVYRSRFDWITDRIWADKKDEKISEITVDCTSEWGAEEAFYSEMGEYYVKYEDVIFILDEYEDIHLTQKQIDTIREKMNLR